MTDPVAVEFVAEVRQVKTMVDKTINITLNLPEMCRPAAQWFMAHQSDMIKAVCVIEDKSDKSRTVNESHQNRKF